VNVATASNNAAAVYTIRVQNTTGVPITLSQITDSFNNFIVTQCSPDCALPSTQPGAITWQGSVTLQPNDTFTLTINGTFINVPAAPAQVCNPSYTVTWTPTQGQPTQTTETNKACVPAQ
jgi:hypothetical protein